MIKNADIIDLVENAAKIRKDPPVPRDFIAEALEKVKAGEEEVERYPTGAPSLKGLYRMASGLYQSSLHRKLFQFRKFPRWHQGNFLI